MADYASTPSAVVASGTSVPAEAIAAVDLEPGTPIYLDATSGNQAKPTSANASLATAAIAGITINKAYAGQPVKYATDDADFTHGLTGVTTGQLIILSATAGKLAPAADLASGWFPVLAMIAKSATKAHFHIVRGSVAKP